MSKAKKSAPKFDREKLTNQLRSLQRYTVVAFLLLVVATYGFVLLRIGNLSNTEPTEDQINSQVSTASIPKIDEKLVVQLKSLRDNSVNVQSLFDQSRTSPFQ